MDFRLVEKLIRTRFQVRNRENPDELVNFIPNPAQRRLLALCQQLSDEKRRLVSRLCAGDLVPWAQQVVKENKGGA